MLEHGQNTLDSMAADLLSKSITKVNLIRGDAIKPEPIDWLWPDWLAAGKLHILAGAPGTGKTTLALALAAALTVRGRWPDGSRVTRAGDVLIWSGEDDPTDTLAPRLLACGADMARIHFVGSVRESAGSRPFDPAQDMDVLGAAARRIGDVRLLICDPVGPLSLATATKTPKSGEHFNRWLIWVTRLASRSSASVTSARVARGEIRPSAWPVPWRSAHSPA